MSDLKKDIIEAGKRLHINPCITPFKPSDLGLRAENYGSFSDYCSQNETRSGRHNKEVILKVAKLTKAGKPFKYLLVCS